MIQSIYPRRVSLLFGIAIFVVPYIAAWWLLRDGYSTKTRIIGFGWMIWVSGFFIVGNILGPKASQTPPNVTTAAEAPSESQHQPIVTAKAFGLLMPGTSYDFIAGLYGPGELQASSYAAGIKTESYVWSNPDGSNMTLMFQNDRMVMKAQYGLK